MNALAIKEKVLDIEAQLKFVKAILSKKPDFGADEKIWREIRSESKTIRKGAYRREYGQR